MKRLLLVALCLSFVFIQVQGQLPPKFTKTLTKPPTVLVRLPKAGYNLPPKVTVFPYNTPKKRVKEFKSDKHSIYKEYTLPRDIQNGDIINVHLNYLRQKDGHGFYKTQQIIYNETVENAALFDCDNPQPLQDPYKFSISVNKETRAILTDEIKVDEAYVKSAKKKQGRSEDFVFKDSVTYKECIRNFKDFFKQLNQNVDEELIVTAVFKNKVNQVLFSFFKRWEEQGVVLKYNAPVCARFLKQCNVKISCQTDTYTNWLRGAYSKWEKKDKEHYDYKIDSLVNDWWINNQRIQE